MRILTLDRSDVHRGPLILVNARNPVQSISPVPLIPTEHRADAVLLEMSTAALFHGLLRFIGCTREIIPVSGYRSHREQKKLYADSLEENGVEFTKQYVALPGCSEHETGLAVDVGENLGEIDLIRPVFPDAGKCGEFRRHAADYGFIQRYGREKERITGISHEPWHFRYVGCPHAKIMRQRGLCLEEYVEFLKDYPLEGKHLKFEDSGAGVEVFYVKADPGKTELELPEDGFFQISGDNRDGFIGTVWRR